MKPLLSGLLLLFLAHQSWTQPAVPEKLRPLQIGDTVPDLVLQNMINYPGGKARLSDFKGKAIILDFWSRGCIACIRAFPKMQELQNEFQKDLQIILVTKDPTRDINKLIQQSAIVRSIKLPITTGDKYLHDLFPHFVEPYHVWIDKDRVIRHTSSNASTVSNNVASFLEGGEVSFNNRVDNLEIRLSHHRSLLDPGNGLSTGNVGYSSIITGRWEGYEKTSSSQLVDSVFNKVIGIRIMNTSICDLYMAANKFAYPDRVILEVANPEILKKPKDINKVYEWRKNHTYCYELRIGKGIADEERYEIMREDLRRFFGFEARVEKRTIKCLVFRKTDGDAVINPLSNDAGNPMIPLERTNNAYFIRDAFVDAVLLSIRDALAGYEGVPVINEALYQERVTMTLPIQAYRSLKLLRAELAKYGFDLIEELRDLEVLVIRDRQPGFLIEGRIQGLKDGTRLYLGHFKGNKADTVATAFAFNGKFSFEGVVAVPPEPYFIKIDTHISKSDAKLRRGIRLFLDNSVMKIEGEIRHWPHFQFQGSSSHQEYLDFMRGQQDVEAKIPILPAQQDGTKDSIFHQRLLRLSEAYKEYNKSWISSYPNSVFSPWLILQTYREDTQAMKNAYFGLADRVKQSNYGLALRKKIDEIESSGQVKRAPGFSLPDKKGKLVFLKSLLRKNQYLLVDFWASWCKPCQRQFKELNPVYDQYKNKGLTIVRISMDQSKDAWKKAVKQDNYGWVDLYDSEGTVAQQYGVKAIPASFLIDETGQIIDKNISAKELSKRMEELMKTD